MNKDKSDSWVWISDGLNKLVTDLIDKEHDDNEQDTSTTKTEVLAFASRSKAKAKPRRLSTHYLLIFKDCTYSWKKMGSYWTRNSIRSSVRSGKKDKHSSSTQRITSRRRWCDRILETERWSSEQIWVLSILVWWSMEEQDGRRRRQQEKNSILYWTIRTRTSLSPSSSRSFRTQSHWSYTAGQCVDSKQFLRVHLSHRMCIQFTLHHKFRIDCGRTKFFTAVNPMRKDHKDPQELDLTKPRLASYKQKWKVHKIQCTGSIFSLLKGKDWSSIKQDRTQSSSTIHSQLIVYRK